jgi:hypothetical protein
MRESRTSGFVRGAHSNMCPYRDPYLPYLPKRLSKVEATDDPADGASDDEAQREREIVFPTKGRR